MEQELFTLPEYLSSPPVFSVVRVTRSLVCCPFVLFILAIVLSVLLRYTDSDCPVDIFKLFFAASGTDSCVVLFFVVVRVSTFSHTNGLFTTFR